MTWNACAADIFDKELSIHMKVTQVTLSKSDIVNLTTAVQLRREAAMDNPERDGQLAKWTKMLKKLEAAQSKLKHKPKPKRAG